MGAPFDLFDNLDALLPEIPADSIVSRTLYGDASLKIILFGFAAGQELSEHTASKTAILHFLRGEADLTLGGTASRVQAGTLVRMEPHLPHSVHARTDVVMLLIMLGA